MQCRLSVTSKAIRTLQISRRLCSHAASSRQAELDTLSRHIGNADSRHKQTIDEIVRVDHAGEAAAVKIYEGQMFVLRGSKDEALLEVHMLHKRGGSH